MTKPPAELKSPRAQTARPRNRDATHAAILAAASNVLAEGGFQQFGINAVARRAGCDKQLIYRYFGGLDGLLTAIGAGLVDTVGSYLGEATSQPLPRTYADLAEQLVVTYARALRNDVLLQKIIAWEIADDAETMRAFAEARSRALVAWMAERRGSLSPPQDIDAPAANAVLIAAVQHLVLAGAASGRFAGLNLATSLDWERLEATLGSIARRVYADAPSA
jgi:AcrR family transcriptional regulator